MQKFRADHVSRNKILLMATMTEMLYIVLSEIIFLYNCAKKKSVENVISITEGDGQFLGKS